MVNGVGVAVGCMAVCISILNLPFITCDLYYAYMDTSCSQMPITAYQINFTIGTWLLVSGYLSLAMSATLILISFLICCTEKAIGMFIGYLYLVFLYALFSLAWLVVGSVMFWGDLYPGGKCVGGINGYLFARLILGYVSIFVNLGTARRQQGQVQE
jgi:hypothetical protein